jgi:hypothetical protein
VTLTSLRERMRAHRIACDWLLFPWVLAASAALTPTQPALQLPPPTPPSITPASGAPPRSGSTVEEIGQQATAVLVLAIIWFVVGYLRQQQRWWHRLTMRPAAPATRLARIQRAGTSGSVGAPDTLSVRVESSNDQGAFEVRNDLVHSYEDLRAHIVDALPDMFGEDDADLRMTFEYRRANGKWAQSKKSTPFEKLKDAGSVLVRIVDASSYSMPMGARKPGWKPTLPGLQSKYGKVRVVNCSLDGNVL